MVGRSKGMGIRNKHIIIQYSFAFLVYLDAILKIITYASVYSYYSCDL
jgi:hypothetical protein